GRRNAGAAGQLAIAQVFVLRREGSQDLQPAGKRSHELAVLALGSRSGGAADLASGRYCGPSKFSTKQVSRRWLRLAVFVNVDCTKAYEPCRLAHKKSRPARPPRGEESVFFKR